MFQKLVAIEPVSLVEEAEKKLYDYAKEVVLFTDIPCDDEEIIRRIGDADAVLVSYPSRINSYVMERCPNIKYVGMCCSLYSEESANVDIAYARTHGIQVLGIRDYGDRGVVEFVLCELVRLLHGYDCPMWKELPEEITGLKVGIVGIGVSGGMIAVYGSRGILLLPDPQAGERESGNDLPSTERASGILRCGFYLSEQECNSSWRRAVCSPGQP